MSFPNKKYPSYQHRHVHAGDTSNMEVRSPGAPNANRRVYVSDPPASGFPQDPIGSVYPAGTTLMGFKEELESRLVNRMGYAAHADLDSLADRPRYPFKRVTTFVDATAQVLDLFDGNWSSVGTPSNDLLVYLGPPGTTAAQAWRYVCFMRGSDNLPQRAADLSFVNVADVQNIAGVSLYPAALPGPGYYPGGKTGKVIEIDAMDPRQIRLAEVDVGGPDTDLVSLDALCLLNYSLLQRLEQSDHDNLHKAFAVVESHVPAPGAFLTSNRDLSVAGWAVDDVIYLTTVAVMPKVYLDRQCPYRAGSYLMCGGFDRVSENDHDGVTGTVQALGGPRDLIPPLVARIPLYPVGASAWDPFAAIYRADFEPYGPRIQTGFAVNCTQDDALGSPGLAPGYPHWVFMALAYAGDTILDLDPVNNEYQPGPGAGQIDLLGGKRWLNPGTGDSDLLLTLDMVEVYEKSGGTIGDLVGVYYVYTLDPAGTIAQLLTPDGSLAGAGLPVGNGYVRLVRPIFHVTPGIKGPDAKIPGVAQFIGTRSAGVDNAAVRLVDGDSSLMAEGLHKLDSGALLRVFSLRNTGQIRPTGIRVVRQSLSTFPLFSLDGWAAEGRFPFNYRGVSALVAYDEVDVYDGSGSGDTGFAAFAHIQPVGFNRATIIDEIPAGNACLFVGPNTLRLAGGKQWKNGVDSDLFVKHDLVEVQDAVTQASSLWLIDAFSSDTDAQVIRVDGDLAGSGMPGNGFCRILRPRFRQSALLWCNDPANPRIIGDGLRLHVPEPVGNGGLGAGYIQRPGLSLYGRDWTGLLPPIVGVDAGPDKVLSVRKWFAGGTTQETFRLYVTGLMEGFSASDYPYDPPKSFYHDVNLASGYVPDNVGYTPPAGPFPTPPIDTNRWHITYWTVNPNPLEVNQVRCWERYGLKNGNEDKLVFPLNLPDGVTITELRFQYRLHQLPVALATEPHVQICCVSRIPSDWTATLAGGGGGPAYKYDIKVGGAPYNPNVFDPDPWQVLTDVQFNEVGPVGLHKYVTFLQDGLTITIDNSLNEYFVVVIPCGDDVAQSERLFGIRLTYTAPAVSLP